VNRLPTNIPLALAALFLVALHPAADAAAQQKTLKERLVGTWMFNQAAGWEPVIYLRPRKD